MIDCYLDTVRDPRWRGHAEALYPTIALHNALKIEDLGGSGPFTPASLHGKNYCNNPAADTLRPGTLAFRPVEHTAYFPDAPDQFPLHGFLYHPVKVHNHVVPRHGVLARASNRLRRIATRDHATISMPSSPSPKSSVAAARSETGSERSAVRLGRVSQDGFIRVTPLGGLYYLDMLSALHAKMPVRRYLEIGTQSGMSLRLAGGNAVAIDPHFQLDQSDWAGKRQVNLFEMTSDAFFASHDPRDSLEGTIDLAFIDGMHLSEFALRDFINVERYCSPHSLIVLHDIIPQNFEMTERQWNASDRRDKALASSWTGDVWRIVPLLRRERPDVWVQVLDCPATGLAVVGNLNPQHRMPPERLNKLTQTLANRPPTESEFWSFIESLPISESQNFIHDFVVRPQ
jgi:hypothetical protein